MSRKRKSSKPLLALFSCLLLIIGCCATCGSDDSDRDAARELRASPSPSPSTRRVTTKADESAIQACRALAMSYTASMTAADKTALANEVASYSKESSTAGFREASNALTRSSSAGRKAWKASTAKFTALCKKRGWKGLSADDRELRKLLRDIRSGRGSEYSGNGSSSGGSSNGGSRRRGRFW